MLIACGGIHTLFAICAGYVGPDPFIRNMADGSSAHLNAADGVRRFPCHMKNGTTENSTSGVHNSDSHHPDGLTLDKLPQSTVQHSCFSSEFCEAPQIHLTSGSIRSVSEVVSSSQSVMSTLRNKPSISPLVLSGTSSPNDASVAAGDSYFGSGSTDSACMVVDSTPVLRSSKSDELISVLTEATVLLRRCCPRSRLPVSSAEGILRFPLKHS